MYFILLYPKSPLGFVTTHDSNDVIFLSPQLQTVAPFIIPVCTYRTKSAVHVYTTETSLCLKFGSITRAQNSQHRTNTFLHSPRVTC